MKLLSDVSCRYYSMESRSQNQFFGKNNIIMKAMFTPHHPRRETINTMKFTSYPEHFTRNDLHIDPPEERERKIRALVEAMTMEEKFSLLRGSIHVS